MWFQFQRFLFENVYISLYEGLTHQLTLCHGLVTFTICGGYEFSLMDVMCVCGSSAFFFGKCEYYYSQQHLCYECILI
jgi:hypothetical protein